jgi:RNA polymerase sigma-70 factor (ECF subfamily)
MEESNPPPQSVSENVPVAAPGSLQIGSPQHAHLAALVERVRSGDVAALGEMYDATSDVLYGLAMRIVKVECDAEEVVIDTYTRAWRLASEFDKSRGSVLAWLTIMARSIAIDRLRSNESRGARVNEPWAERHSQVSNEESPEEAAVGAERRSLVNQVLRDLPVEQKEILELSYFQGLSQSEIAAKLSIPLGTVKTRARLGMAHMRDMLEEIR